MEDVRHLGVVAGQMEGEGEGEEGAPCAPADVRQEFNEGSDGGVVGVVEALRTRKRTHEGAATNAGGCTWR